jgi:hypothetical protein
VLVKARALCYNILVSFLKKKWRLPVGAAASRFAIVPAAGPATVVLGGYKSRTRAEYELSKLPNASTLTVVPMQDTGALEEEAKRAWDDAAEEGATNIALLLRAMKILMTREGIGLRDAKEAVEEVMASFGLRLDSQHKLVPTDSITAS